MGTVEAAKSIWCGGNSSTGSTSGGLMGSMCGSP